MICELVSAHMLGKVCFEYEILGASVWGLTGKISFVQYAEIRDSFLAGRKLALKMFLRN